MICKYTYIYNILREKEREREREKGWRNGNKKGDRMFACVCVFLVVYKT